MSDDIESIDIAQLRAHVERFKDVFFSTDPKTADSRAKAVSVIRAVGGRDPFLPLPGQTFAKTIDNALRVVTVTQDDSNAAFRDAYEGLTAHLNDLDALQTAVRSNANLTPKEARHLVLQTVARIDKASSGKEMWSNELQENARLSNAQIEDALEHWSRKDAIEILNSSMALTGRSSRFRLTALGRDIANGEPQESSGAFTNIHIDRSQIANLGHNFGVVNQTITNNFPEPPGDVRELLNRSDTGISLLASLDDELAEAEPRKNMLGKIVLRIKTFIENGVLVYEGTEAVSQWFADAHKYLGH